MTDTASTRTMLRARYSLGLGLLALGAVVATTVLLGPFALDVIHYRTSPTTLNQLIGGDAAALAVVVPLCAAAGVLALRGWRFAPALALAPAFFAVYTYTQLVVGQEYLRLPGNNERFFPLLLSGFLLGGAVALVAWSNLDPARLPVPAPRLRRLTAGVLLAVAGFLLLEHLPSLADAMRDHPTRIEYISSPTPFWLVKLMDLGIVAPLAALTGVGLARGRSWALRPMYAIVGAYTLLGASVTGMAVTMLARDDPDASLPVAIGFATLTLALGVLTLMLFRGLARREPQPQLKDEPEPAVRPRHGGRLGRYGRTLVALEIGLGVAAAAGGVQLMANPDDAMPADLLTGTPFSTWFWPGVALIATVAAPATLVAIGALRSRAFVHIGHACVGVVLMGWIAVQLLVIGPSSWLQPFCAAWGAVIAGLGWAHLRQWEAHRPGHHGILAGRHG